MGEDPNRQGNSRRWIIQECENSLRRLGTDWIDLYQIHRPSPECDVDETLGALTDLIRAGKVRYAGSSTFPASEIVEAQWTAERRGRERFVCEQPPYSILVRGVEADVLPTCQRYGMGVIPWSPLAGGWLTGRYRKGQEIPVSHRAERVPVRYDMALPGNQAKLEAADALANAGRARPASASSTWRWPSSSGTRPSPRRSSARGPWSSWSPSSARSTSRSTTTSSTPSTRSCRRAPTSTRPTAAGIRRRWPILRCAGAEPTAVGRLPPPVVSRPTPSPARRRGHP